MGYHIKYEELSRTRESLLSQLDSWLEQIESLKGSLRMAADMPEMKGAAGDSVRNYLKEVHLSLVEMIQHTIQVYRDNLVLYTSWYYSIETDMMAEFRQESIENQMELLNSGRFTYDDTMEELSGILSEVSNYMSIEPVSRLPVTSRYATTYIHLDNLNNALGQYEEAHKNADLTLTEEMIRNITAIIHGHQSLSNDTISTYQAGSISELPGFQYASLLDGLQKNYLDQVSGTVEECETVYVGRKEAWEEEIRQRKEQAMVSMIAAVGTLIIGGIVIFCTFGMATPLVVGTTALTLSSVVSVSAGFAIGGATFLYGESNFCESYNSYQYGLKGDARTVAENPIRDTCFAGDPELYYTVGNVCTMTASMMIPVGGSMMAAVNAGASPVRAGLTELGMLGYSSVMASETADIVTDMTDSELAGMVAGTIVGMESYGGLKTLDQSVNISGLYSPKVAQTRSMKEIAGSNQELLGSVETPVDSFAELMPPEQAERYLKFLENGSMEGLTDAEIAAIRKVDDALALQKVDGQSVLNLRNSMAGESSSVLESGRPTAIYGSEDIANYQHNMIENPGPLAEMPNQPARNFYGGRYNMEVLQEDRIMYRAGNSQNPYGRWFTSEPPASVANVRIDTAVKPQWIDPITGELTGESVVDTVYAIKIPKGTTVYTGPVGSQGGAYLGGYDIMQTYIDAPWTFEVIGKTYLK
ncbi:MAG: LXG domain-containing protein [Lachnospiraceae bacterium]|nr:LXG domain-containing protein [Lachnospiraceae bacterium]